MHIDKQFNQFIQNVKSDKIDEAKRDLEELKKDIESKIKVSSRAHVINNIQKIVNYDKDAYILDCGCGGGTTMIYLYLLGYKNVYGVNISSQEFNNKVMALITNEKEHFFYYDGEELPFGDNYFDLVFSEQVLEHVQDIQTYYRETFRVLKNKAFAYHLFPQRLMPYDSHTKTWFIHMFPYSLRKTMFTLLKQDFEYIEELLNLQTISYHKKEIRDYCSNVENLTEARLLSFTQEDLERYEGNKKIRYLVDRLAKNKLLGSFFRKILANLAIAELKMQKI